MIPCCQRRLRKLLGESLISTAVQIAACFRLGNDLRFSEDIRLTSFSGDPQMYKGQVVCFPSSLSSLSPVLVHCKVTFDLNKSSRHSFGHNVSHQGGFDHSPGHLQSQSVYASSPHSRQGTLSYRRGVHPPNCPRRIQST